MSDNLIITFETGNVSLVNLSPEMRLSTLAAFSCIQPGEERLNTPHPLTVVSGDIAAVIYGTNRSLLTLIPLKPVGGRRGRGLTYQDATVHTLTRGVVISLAEGAGTLYLLTETRPSAAEREAVNPNPCSLYALGLSGLAKPTLLWSLDGLPYDAYSVVTCPPPIGGALVLSPRALIHKTAERALWMSSAHSSPIGFQGEVKPLTLPITSSMTSASPWEGVFQRYGDADNDIPFLEPNGSLPLPDSVMEMAMSAPERHRKFLGARADTPIPCERPLFMGARSLALSATEIFLVRDDGAMFVVELVSDILRVRPVRLMDPEACIGLGPWAAIPPTCLSLVRKGTSSEGTVLFIGSCERDSLLLELKERSGDIVWRDIRPTGSGVDDEGQKEDGDDSEESGASMHSDKPEDEDEGEMVELPGLGKCVPAKHMRLVTPAPGDNGTRIAGPFEGALLDVDVLDASTSVEKETKGWNYDAHVVGAIPSLSEVVHSITEPHLPSSRGFLLTLHKAGLVCKQQTNISPLYASPVQWSAKPPHDPLSIFSSDSKHRHQSVVLVSYHSCTRILTRKDVRSVEDFGRKRGRGGRNRGGESVDTSSSSSLVSFRNVPISECSGFILDEPTLFASSIQSGWMVQVTPTSVRILGSPKAQRSVAKHHLSASIYSQSCLFSAAHAYKHALGTVETRVKRCSPGLYEPAGSTVVVLRLLTVSRGESTCRQAEFDTRDLLGSQRITCVHVTRSLDPTGRERDARHWVLVGTSYGEIFAFKEPRDMGNTFPLKKGPSKTPRLELAWKLEGIRNVKHALTVPGSQKPRCEPDVPISGLLVQHFVPGGRKRTECPNPVLFVAFGTTEVAAFQIHTIVDRHASAGSLNDRLSLVKLSLQSSPPVYQLPKKKLDRDAVHDGLKHVDDPKATDHWGFRWKGFHVKSTLPFTFVPLVSKKTTATRRAGRDSSSSDQACAVMVCAPPKELLPPGSYFPTSVVAVPTMIGAPAFIPIGRPPSSIIRTRINDMPTPTSVCVAPGLGDSRGPSDLPFMLTTTQTGAVVLVGGFELGSQRGPRPKGNDSRNGSSSTPLPPPLPLPLRSLPHYMTLLNPGPSPAITANWFPPGLKAHRIACHRPSSTVLLAGYTTRHEIRPVRSRAADTAAEADLDDLLKEVDEQATTMKQNMEDFKDRIASEILKLRPPDPALHPDPDHHMTDRVYRFVLMSLEDNAVLDSMPVRVNRAEHISSMVSGLIQSAYPSRFGAHWRPLMEKEDDFGRTDRRNRFGTRDDTERRLMSLGGDRLTESRQLLFLAGTTFAQGEDERAFGRVLVIAVEPVTLAGIEADKTLAAKLNQTAEEEDMSRWGSGKEVSRYALRLLVSKEVNFPVSSICALPRTGVILTAQGVKLYGYRLVEAQDVEPCSFWDGLGYVPQIKHLRDFLAVPDMLLGSKLMTFRTKGNRQSLLAHNSRKAYLSDFAVLRRSSDVSMVSVEMDRTLSVSFCFPNNPIRRELESLFRSAEIRLTETPIELCRYLTPLVGVDSQHIASRQTYNDEAVLVVTAEGSLLAVIPTPRPIQHILRTVMELAYGTGMAPGGLNPRFCLKPRMERMGMSHHTPPMPWVDTLSSRLVGEEQAAWASCGLSSVLGRRILWQIGQHALGF
eukprot:gnl/Dysnectes_brevis/2131_a2477_768.p1 GENE.gnl/Dysnectes_brevis/2131_a2477_768~~gnl/Dysnectes_brevis/2131_a2477_768.p1  ORF type:complete len:1723 (-),score=266.47 gnl/Dysnectes_brevis/2131_a2477_768:33-4943(-)